MNEIKCPNCGKVFQVDEAGYASIVSQVRNALFEKEVADRISSVRRESAAVQEKALAELDAKHKLELAGKDQEILRLKESARAAETEKQLAVQTAVQQKDTEIISLKDKIELDFRHTSCDDDFFSEFPETADLIKDLLLCRVFDGAGIADIDLCFFCRDRFMSHGTNNAGHRFRSSLACRTTERFKIDFHSQTAPVFRK